MNYLIITLIGPDRPGLVESVAQTVATHHGNWTESRMAHLAGQFAGILQVSVPTEHMDALVRALHNLESDSLKLIVEESDAGKFDNQPAQQTQLHVSGSDRTGIVSEITRVLASRNVNVEAIETECVNAPMSGEKIFHANATLQLPTDLSLGELRDRLEQIASDLVVEISPHGTENS